MAESPDPESCLVPGEEELQHAICMLTSTEKDIITDVLQRDKEVRSQEKQRLSDLKVELDEIKLQGIPEGEETKHRRICVRCRTPLGAIFNTGDLCPWCRKRVCRNCKRPTEKSWLCVLCYKEREIKGESGEWFYGSLPKKKRLPYGSTLLKKLIKRRKSQAYKLSKSRNRSDDDSCEIEYAIAETFGEDASSADRQYVLVDKESNGSISISEGNVVSYDHFGSEAAALSSIDEVHESEAAINDVAFTGTFVSGFDSNEKEGRPSAGEFQGPDTIPRGNKVEKKEGEKRVKLVVQANPFLDENDSETEEREEDRNVKGSDYPELSTQSQIPPKPIRGIMRSTEDLNRLSIERELLSSGECEKRTTVVIESNVNNKMTVEKHFEDQLEESQDITEKEDVISHKNDDRRQNEMDMSVLKIEVAGDDENRDSKKELDEGSVFASPEDDANSYASGYDDESEKDIIAMNNDSGIVKYDAGTNAVVSGDADISVPAYQPENDAEDEERSDRVPVAQKAEEVGAEKISSTVPDADTSILNIPTPPTKEISTFNAIKYYGNPAEKGFLDHRPVDKDSQGLKINEESLIEVKSGTSVKGNFNSKGNERGSSIVLLKGENVNGTHDGVVGNGNETKLRDQAVIKENEVLRGEPEIEKDISAVRDSVEVEEKQFNFKERMNFYKRKELESDGNSHITGERVKLEIGHKQGRSDGSLFKSEFIPATEAESRALHSNRENGGLFTENENKQSEENYPGLSKKPENERKQVEFLSVLPEKKEELMDRESRLEEREDIFTGKSLEGKDESIERNNEADYAQATSGALEFEPNEEEQLMSDLHPKMDVKEDIFEDDVQESVTEKNVSEESHVSDEKETEKILVGNHEGCKENLNSYEEDQSFEIAPKYQTLKEDHQFLKSDVGIIEEHQAINVAEDISVPEKEPVTNVIIPTEREVKVTYTYETEKSNSVVESSLADDKSLADDSTIRTDDALIVPSLNDQLKAESSQSIASYQSDTELYDTLRPELKVAGQILLGLKFDHGSQHFEVQVHKATDLIAVDTKKNTSDPYVKTYLQEDGVRLHKKKTKAKKQTLNPVFDEIIKYKIDYERLIEMTVAVSVWHNDIFGQNVFLGETQIIIAEYLESGYSLDDPAPQEYQLAEKRLNRNDMKDVGEIVIEMKYIPPGGVKPQGKPGAKTDPLSGQLVVRCVEGKNLDGTEDSNPFCELRLASVKSKGKRPTQTTAVEAKTVNPYWDQEILFENVTFNDLTNSVIEVRVLDASVGKKAKFLGAVRLGSGTSNEPFDDPSAKECTAWQKLLQEPNRSTTTTLSLRSTLGSLKSSASLPPILVEREEDMKYQVREKKSDSILSQTSISSATDDASSLRGTLTRTKLKPQPDQFSLQSFGSMLSIYSDAGGYGSVPISGEMLFSIKYDNIAGVFEVHVQKAKGIAAVNKKTRASDPYVKTYLLPDKSKESKKKTNFKRRTVNPEWDEKIKYKIGEKDIMKRTLQVSIWNHEKFGHNDFLGEVQVQIQQYVKNGHNLNVHEPIWYTLQESAPVSVGEAVYKGSITVGLKFDRVDGEIGNLMIDIRHAKDLSAADPTQLSNPFVKSYLLPDRARKSKRKSTFKKGTLDPVWNEKFEYSGVTLEELEPRVLELTVWDHDLHTNDFLGGTRLGLERGDESWHDCIGKEVSIWNAMLEHPGIWVQYTIPLRDSMTSRKGMDVKIPEIEQDTKTKLVSELDVAKSKGDETYPVVKDGNNIKSNIDIDHSAPLLRIGLMFVTKLEEEKKTKGTLRMMLKEARNLPLLPNGETPSTYCRCQLKPSRMSWRTKTDLFKRSSEPAWESLFEFEDVDNLKTKCAEIVLCNIQNDKIGLVRLGSGLMQESWDDSKGREKEIWMATMENPNSWNYLMIPLRMNIDEKSNRKMKIDEPETSAKTFESVKTESASTPASPSEDGQSSAKELALQSMGSHAVSVRSQESKPRSQSQDNLFRTLSLIREEDDGEDQSRVRFAGRDQSEPSTRRLKSSVPSILVSQEKGAITDPNEIPDKDVDIDAEPDLPSNLKKMSKFGSRESISSRTSVYSTMSHSAAGGVPVRGSIQFGLVYQNSTSTFQVHIFKADNIAAVDAKKEISDPYVKCYLLPDKTKATKKKTKVKFKTLNPEWNEIIEYRMPLNDLRTKTLMISLWNYDRLGRNIFLGEVLLPMVDKVDQGALTGHSSDWYDLEEMKSAKSQIVYKGQISIALRFEDNALGLSAKKEKKNVQDKKDKKDKKKKKEKGRIHIHVIKGEDIPAGDNSGLCDPYCKFYLLPLRQSKTKRKTSVIRGSREAYWDYQTEYDVDVDELPELGIEFTVYDWDKSGRNDFLGCARLNLGGRTGKWDDALGIEREAWQKLINEPNVRHEFVIPLRSSLDTRPLEE